MGDTFAGKFVDAFVVHNSELYTNIYTPATMLTGTTKLHKWNGSAWVAIGETLASQAVDMGVYDGDIVAGLFSMSPPVTLGGIARWDGVSWSDVGGGTDGAVFCVVEYEGNLIAGGAFALAGGNYAGNVASWNGSSWSGMGTGMLPGLNNWVWDLIVYNGRLVAGGEFTSTITSGVPVSRVAQWDGTDWAPVGSDINDDVFALCVHDGNLYAGGEFTTAGGITANRIAVWDGNAWHPLGSGITGDEYSKVDALAVFNGDIYALGDFVYAGGLPSRAIARWILSGE
jgi:hypothetical protein